MASNLDGTVYWIGGDGNVWFKDGSGVKNVGKPIKNFGGNGFDAEFLSAESRQIDDPNPQTTQTSAPSGGEVDPDDAMRASLRGEIGGFGGQVDSVYASLLSDLDKLLKSRSGELEADYGKQFGELAGQYADAIPEIETSYAALGAGNSTDNTYAKNDAKDGFDSSTATVGENKKKDLAKLGQYGKESRTSFTTDRDTAKREIGRAGSTTDVNALRGLRNNVESNIDTAKKTRSTLGTDGQATKDLSALTADGGRYQETVNALDGILKSSLSGSVKEAAVSAITDSAGLSDKDKKKVQETYGNVYAEQSAL